MITLSQIVIEATDEDAKRALRIALKKEFASHLVRAWMDDRKMFDVIAETLKSANVEMQEGAFRDLNNLILGGIWCDPQTRTRVWVSRNMKELSDFLWAGRPEPECLRAAKNALGLKGTRIDVRRNIRFRERDKSHDWQTVK